MSKKTLESLGAMIKNKRGDRKLRETATEIGIGAATLMRIEAGHMPDIHTFGKVCRWLAIDPNELLGTNPAQAPVQVFAAHLRADRTPQLQTVQALAKMISMALAQQAQPTVE